MSRPADLRALLNIRYPIVQAPMVGVSTPELAAAVSNAGALGSIGIGASSAEQARKTILATRALTDKPFNVNVFCHQEAVPDPEREARWLSHLKPFFMEFGSAPPSQLKVPYKSFTDDHSVLDMLLGERPAVVSFHFGLPPADWIKSLRQAGIVTFACATTPDEASLIEAAGVDVIVAQGVEAGGHRGVFEPKNGDLQLGILPLIRMISSTTSLPVIGAGGIMDGQGIDAVLRLGATGAQLGTAFILCPESCANDGFRTALKSDLCRHTRITSTISGRPARGIINRFHSEIDLDKAPELPDYPIAYDAGKALASVASAHGSPGFSAHWAGQGAPLAREMPATELVKRLVRESELITAADQPGLVETGA